MRSTASRLATVSLAVLAAAGAALPALSQSPTAAVQIPVNTSEFRGEACVGLVGHSRKVNPLPARGPDGAIGSIPSDGTDKVLAVTGCDATSYIIRYQNADWAVSRSLLGVRWLQTGDRLDGGALITPAMREKAVLVQRTPVATQPQAPVKCDDLTSVARAENNRIFGAAGLTGEPQTGTRCVN